MMRLFGVLDEFQKRQIKIFKGIQNGMNMYMTVGDAERCYFYINYRKRSRAASMLVLFIIQGFP